MYFRRIRKYFVLKEKNLNFNIVLYCWRLCVQKEIDPYHVYFKLLKVKVREHDWTDSEPWSILNKNHAGTSFIFGV